MRHLMTVATSRYAWGCFDGERSDAMRTVELRAGSIQSLAHVERPPPKPGAGQVAIRMRAASLNYRDLMIATGRYARGASYPLIPLSDGAGEILEVGEGVTNVAVGDRVMGAFFQRWIDGEFERAFGDSALGGAIDGVLAEQVVLQANAVVSIPVGLSFEQAACLPCAAVTAWVGLVEFGKLEAGETVLAMGTGGVSVFALQLAKAMGARVLVTSSQDAKLQRATSLGADGVINYSSTPDWGARARELTMGRGVDHILEIGGAGTLAQSLDALADRGHVALIGQLSGAYGDKDAVVKRGRGLRVDRVYVGSVRHLRKLSEFVARKGIRPVVDRIVPFDDVAAAYRALESGAHFGKIVVSFP
jgi:NADPH:quinone reductase-like Zn-dependent oxidoreductase